MNIRWMFKKDGGKAITGTAGMEWGDEDVHHHSEHDMGYHKKKECPGMIRAKYVLEHRPSTWTQYEGKPDGPIHIVEMEIAELKAAYEGLKTGTHTVDDVLHELGDVAAASMSAYTTIINKHQK